MQCLICQKNYDSFVGLSAHIVKSHCNSKKYYDDFLLKENEGKCTGCGSPTAFININKGYRLTCSISCRSSSEHFKTSISIQTKKAMWKPDIREKYLKNKPPISQEQKDNLSKQMKIRHLDKEFKSKIYTEERNNKISESKKKYWAEHPNEKVRVGNIWKGWKARDEVGWRKHLMSASKLGFEKMFSPDGDTSLEIKLYSMLNYANIKFIKKYELSGKVYDAYLIDYNTLIEVDGSFWHQLKLEYCKYDFQKESFYNDIVKNEIAQKNNINLIRIRENNFPEDIKSLLI